MATLLRDYSDFEPQKLTKTPEGYLTGRIRVTCAGVFPYRTENGLVRRLRPRDEVGKPESVASANSKPLTLRHPNENVTPDNIKKYQVGFTGNDAYFDGLDMWLTITVTDRKALDAIERGEVKAVSMGYDVADLLNEPGNWRGTEYDEVMKGIQYNHVALVYAGRAGDNVNFTVGDSADFERIFNSNKTDDGKKSSAKDSAMKKIIIDGAVYECDEAVAAKVAGLEKQLADSAAAHKAELDKVTAERDAAQAEVKTLKESQKDEAEIVRLANEKLELVATAKKYGCDVKTEDSALDIKKAVIAKAFGDKMDLTEKSADYVAVAYDSAILHLDSVADKKDDKKSPLANDMGNLKDTADPEDAYKKMCDQLAGKTKKEA